MFAVVTGGGTSGHVMPAVAVLELLKEAGHPADDLAYVGARRGVETRLLADTDVRAEFLPVSGLQRSMSPRSILRNVAFPFRVIASRVMAVRLLRRWSPRVVVSVGGYASDPMSFAARILGVPLVCVSYDRVAGLATRKQAKHATVCAVAFEGSTLPRAVVTGAPVRSEMRNLDVAQRRSAAREALGIPLEAILVTVMGGSLGSGVLNGAVPSILSACADSESVFVFHMCGERFEKHSIASHVPTGIIGYRSVGYESRMADVYAATDVLVARAGASTVAEIATVGLASVLVPWAQAADNHQQLNAEWLGDASAAVVLPESSCADGRLAGEVKRLVAALRHAPHSRLHPGEWASCTAERHCGASSRTPHDDSVCVKQWSAMSPRRRLDTQIDLSRSRRCHVVGVGGPGMSPIALVLKGFGHDVSGSDMTMSPVIDSLRSAGIFVSIGHSADHVDGVDIVTHSTAIPAGNPELVAAREHGAVVCHRSTVLAALCGATDSVAVAGTHGKTTTSALLSLILVAAGRDPSCIVGGDVPDFGGGARVGGGAGLVLEADESDGTLDVLEPAHLVITNVDVDHLDYFGSFAEVQQSFVDAARRTRGFVVLNADDPMSEPVRSAMSGVDSAITFGCSATADVRLGEFVSTPTGSVFDLSFRGESRRFATLLRGVHNAMNCAAAVAMACLHGVSLAESAEAVRGFAGVGRRFTERGIHDGVTFVDDYAHLPAEIEAALDSARSHPSLTGRVVAVFQPNRFHRIAAMADSYAHCFERADCVVVTDVYASGTEPIDGVTGELVVDAIRSAHPDSTVVWARHRADVVREVLAYVRPGDLCISMGCGDIETFPDDVAAAVS